MSARAAAIAAGVLVLVPPGLDAQSGTIRVTIGGGPHAGTYEMSESCLLQPSAYPTLHIMGFSTGPVDPKSPRTMEFFTASKQGMADGFVAAVSFQDARYEIFAIPREMAAEAPPLRGRGNVTVKQTPTGRTATFRGQTKDGVKMEGTIECRTGAS